MNSEYTKIVKDHFFHPRDVGRLSISSGSGTVGNSFYGDFMTIDISVEGSHIQETKFQTYGSSVAIGNKSINTEIIKGNSIDECMNLIMDNIISQLSWLPKEKTHCNNLATKALKKTIVDFQEKNKR